jgi:hypothetical protein
LGKLKALFIVDAGYYPPAGYTYNPPVPTDERITTAEIELINQAYKNGLNVFITGDNGKPANTNNQDAASLAGPVTNALQKAVVYKPEAYRSVYEYSATLGTVAPYWGSQVSLLSSAVFDLRTGALNTPGYLAKGADASVLNSSCLVPTYQRNYKVPTSPYLTSCLVGYVPSNNGTGMMVVDANAGYPTRSIIGNLIDEACKLN